MTKFYIFVVCASAALLSTFSSSYGYGMTPVIEDPQSIIEGTPIPNILVCEIDKDELVNQAKQEQKVKRFDIRNAYNNYVENRRRGFKEVQINRDVSLFSKGEYSEKEAKEIFVESNNNFAELKIKITKEPKAYVLRDVEVDDGGTINLERDMTSTNNGSWVYTDTVDVVVMYSNEIATLDEAARLVIFEYSRIPTLPRTPSMDSGLSLAVQYKTPIVDYFTKDCFLDDSGLNVNAYKHKYVFVVNVNKEDHLRNVLMCAESHVEPEIRVYEESQIKPRYAVESH